MIHGLKRIPMEPKKNKKEPTFIDQASALIDSHYENNGSEHNMTIADHKLLCHILDAHEKYIEDKNNDFSTKLIGDVNEVIGNQWIRVLREELNKHTDQLNGILQGIADDIESIKDRLETTENKLSAEERRIEMVEEWQKRKKLRIEKLEVEMAMFQPESLIEMRQFAKEFREVKPLFMRWGKIFDWWTIKNWWKLVLICVALLGLFFGLIWFSHKVRWVSGLGKQQSSRIDDIYARMRTGTVSTTTRAIHLDYTKLSSAQKDSVHEANIQAVEKTIK